MLFLFLFAGSFIAKAQDNDVALETGAVKNDTVKRKMVKVDGVAAVVGDYIILESDIEKTLQGLKNQGYPSEDLTHCNLLGKLMEDKLYMHSAVQDSIEVSQAEIRAGVDRRIDYFMQQVNGDMKKLIELYGMETEGELREELSNIVKEQMLTERMRDKIIEEIEVTPEEVRTFFYAIPEEERPVFGESVELAQIVIKPDVPEEETQKVIERLRKMKEDVEDNGVRFSSKAMLYSEDPGSRTRGGLYVGITRKTQFAKEFVDVAFSLKEGEVSEPFQTDFGWHILTVDKIKGEQRDVRHILIRPEIPQSAIEAAKSEIDSIRSLLINDKISFEEAAKAYSDEKETKYDGGKLINPQTLDLKFELAKMDQEIHSNIYSLKEGEITTPILEDNERTGEVFYKIIKVNKRVPDHKADYSQDYTQIAELALRDKQLKEIKKWTEEKIEDTFINVGEDNRNCEFANNWLKN
ncbi:peptidylprolyl isomerase [Neptunitalea sp. Y10]|uniref:Peptidylprolyl isomerase n=2 Tax=Neptunitalea lumnitzerae TaxID=2965509 RepID=A0ABQ5MM54_9FLAO|nr:peptidylprolyl isomerase [Neptunitalea sp. Y10]